MAKKPQKPAAKKVKLRIPVPKPSKAIEDARKAALKKACRIKPEPES
ncbi:MAG: hypothetical protein BWZ10_01473 [candidate division BRC1 bacterium ADurb.BinA364]|nr:MAG: hypothetical protein BWZ10_01473 [candidate division BRC1 bacterium ADurb.BinA364]